MSLKPFFCYYGGKWRIAPRYPKPTYHRIIEPFAGAAGYSLRYFRNDVKLFDADEVICSLWSYLIKVSEREILKLPDLVECVDDHSLIPEAKSLIGFWLNKGSSHPRKSASAWARSRLRPNSYWGEAIRERIATQVCFIRHWKIEQCSFEKIENFEATWFIDPPYEGPAGRLYKHRNINYQVLSHWCQERKGQAIVCEGDDARWLPFRTLGTFKSTEGSRGKKKTSESVWINYYTGINETETQEKKKE